MPGRTLKHQIQRQWLARKKRRFSMSQREGGHTREIQFKRVLIATDFSDASRNALRYAAAIARNHEARLHVVHVVSSVGYRMVGPDAEIHAAELAARELKELWNKLGGANQSSKFELALIVRQGEICAQIEDVVEKEHVDLVVVGTHGRTGLSKVMMGSVAEEIFRKARCPVLTVGPASSWSWPQNEVGAEKVILFSSNLGDASMNALPYAVTIANRSKSKLIMLHVARLVAPADPMSIFGHTLDAVQEEIRQRCMQQLRSQMPDNLNVESELRVTFGLPADGVLAEARSTGAGLIVLGVERKSLFAATGHSPSSTAYEVVTEAECPVLSVRC